MLKIKTNDVLSFLEKGGNQGWALGPMVKRTKMVLDYGETGLGPVARDEAYINGFFISGTECEVGLGPADHGKV